MTVTGNSNSINNVALMAMKAADSAKNAAYLRFKSAADQNLTQAFRQSKDPGRVGFLMTYLSEKSSNRFAINKMTDLLKNIVTGNPEKADKLLADIFGELIPSLKSPQQKSNSQNQYIAGQIIKNLARLPVVGREVVEKFLTKMIQDKVIDLTPQQLTVLLDGAENPDQEIPAKPEAPRQMASAKPADSSVIMPPAFLNLAQSSRVNINAARGTDRSQSQEPLELLKTNMVRLGEALLKGKDILPRDELMAGAKQLQDAYEMIA